MGNFQKFSRGSETLGMTSEELGEMFEGDSADMCTVKFPLMLMGGRANGQACADGEQGPHRREWKFVNKNQSKYYCLNKSDSTPNPIFLLQWIKIKDQSTEQGSEIVF